ncbi:cytochrome P450 [Nonomuraea sp. NPDC050556]|uniref:cytochrome P450 n=1 Tax=Nonomuraea sp. NPDC050556 TaxID=3364369 RepID=UPI0037A67D38
MQLTIQSHDDARRALAITGPGPIPAPLPIGEAPNVGEGVLSGGRLRVLVGPDVVRTLALLARDAHACATAVKELAVGGPTPFLRGCLVEALRLWPRAPFLTRVTTAPVAWQGIRLPAGTTITIPVHLLAPVQAFSPWHWLSAGTPADLCAEETLTLGQAALASLLPERGYELLDPVPAKLDPSRLRFAVHRVGRAVPRPAHPTVPRQRENAQAAVSSRVSRLTSDA